MSDKIDHERIARYLDQEMSPEEQQEFEADLKTRPDLEQAFQQRRKLAASIWLTGRDQERESLGALGDELLALGRPETLPEIEIPSEDIPPSPILTPLWRRFVLPLSIAATILLLVLVIPRWLQPDKMSSQELFAANYDPNALALSFDSGLKRGDGASSDSLIQHIEGAFLADQHNHAIPFLERLQTQLPGNASVRYYIAVALLQDGKHAQAAPIFLELSRNSDVGHWAKWFGAMSYLAMDQPEKAKPLLESLVQQDGYKKHESQDLLEQLK
ncbi:MAG: hypothetical protein AAF587_15575 [Bacteroidota bacterium]